MSMIMMVFFVILFILFFISVLPGIVLIIWGYANDSKNIKLAGIVVAVLGFQMIAAYIFFFFLEYAMASNIDDV